MRHHTLDMLNDPHVPNNDPMFVQQSLETVLQEMTDDIQFGNMGGIEDRIARLEAGFMLLAARMIQTGNL